MSLGHSAPYTITLPYRVWNTFARAPIREVVDVDDPASMTLPSTNIHRWIMETPYGPGILIVTLIAHPARQLFGVANARIEYDWRRSIEELNDHDIVIQLSEP